MILQQSKWESSCGMQEVPRLINSHRWSTSARWHGAMVEGRCGTASERRSPGPSRSQR